MKLLQNALKCALKLCLQAIKVLLVCVFLISRTRLFHDITAIINLEQFSILSAFSKILKTARWQKHSWVSWSTGTNNISFLITDLVRTKFMLYRFPIFFGTSFLLKYRLPTHSTKFQFFSKNWCYFHINPIKGRFVKRQLKMLGMVQNNCFEPP